VNEDLFGEEAEVGLAEFIGVAGKDEATDDLADGVRVAEKSQPHKGPPPALDFPKILLSLGFQLAEPDSAMLVPEALDGAFRAGGHDPLAVPKMKEFALDGEKD